jgi:hypothetical protein
MAGMTLVESAKYSQDTLQVGVIETITRTSAVLELLPFMEIEGNSYAYSQETALPNTEFRAVNTGYTAGVGEITRATESLCILGGDVDLDRFIVQTRSNINDIRAIQTAMKAKAIANTFSDKFFNGNTAVDANSFNGLAKRLKNVYEVKLTVGSTIDLDDLNKLVDMVEGGADVLYMNKTTKRALLTILQASQHYIEVGQDTFGRPVQMYSGIPIRTVEDTILPANEIYAVKFGVMDAVCGIENGGISVRDLGEIDSMPVLRTRIEWYCGMAIFHPRAACVLYVAAA